MIDRNYELGQIVLKAASGIYIYNSAGCLSVLDILTEEMKFEAYIYIIVYIIYIYNSEGCLSVLDILTEEMKFEA